MKTMESTCNSQTEVPQQPGSNYGSNYATSSHHWQNHVYSLDETHFSEPVFCSTADI